MTSQEYLVQTNANRSKRPSLTAKAMRKIRAVMTEWGRKIADIIRDGEIVGSAPYQQFDFETQRKLDQSVMEASREVADSLRSEIPALIATTATLSVATDTAFVWDAWSGKGSAITEAGLAKMFQLATDRAIAYSLTVPIAGQSFLSTVPNISRYFSDDVVAMVQAALRQGRDVGKIAADVNVFIKDGKKLTISRWGEILEPGSAELLKRIRFDQVDYRALQLARTELGRALQETAKANGPSNPGGTGLYDWVRVNAIGWECKCPENAYGSPYTLDGSGGYKQFPPYAHPNCACFCRQRLKNGNDFRDELKRWANGESVTGIDEWYNRHYLPAQAG